MSVESLVEITGYKKRTIKGALQQLEGLRMAESTDNGWVSIERDLDEIAAELGVTGRVEQRHENHVRERAGFGENLERRREAARSRARSHWPGRVWPES
jgi:hypothetical protein